MQSSMTVKQLNAATLFGAKSPLTARTRVVAKAEPTKTPVPSKAEPLTPPEWLPESAHPAFNVLVADDVKLSDIKETEFYKNTLSKVAETDVYKETVGFKPTAEILNGRLAMLGFLGGAFAEVFGQGTIVSQLGSASQATLIIALLITVGTIYPMYKAIDGDYVESLKDTYSVPDGVFTAPLELFHARLAMVGLSTVILIEMAKGSALF